MTPEQAVLAENGGWDFDEADVCWMDHADGERVAGYRKTWTDRHGRPWEIFLCAEDGAVLEAGAYEGGYAGAPTPPGSMAAEWPWAAAGQAVPEAV